MSTEAGSPPAAPPEAPPRAAPGFRAYFAVVSGLLTLGGAAMAALAGLGFSESSSAPSFLAAALLGAVGCGAWALVVRSRGTGGAGGLAWVAFPVALFSLVGMVPLLVIASFPEMLGRLGAPDRALLAIHGRELEIEFPRAMRRGALNLELDGVLVPPDYLRDRPDRGGWRLLQGPGIRPRSLLVLDLEALRRELGLGAVKRLAINCSDRAPAMNDELGQRLEPQRLDLPPRPREN